MAEGYNTVDFDHDDVIVDSDDTIDSVDTDDIKDYTYDFWLNTLCRRFEDGEWPGTNAALTKLLHKFLSIFIERSFEEYLHAYCCVNDTHETSEDLITKLDSELEEIRLYPPFSHYEFNPGTRLGHRQLMLYTAATFIPPKFVCGSMILSPSDIARKTIEDMYYHHTIAYIIISLRWEYRDYISQIDYAYNIMKNEGQWHNTSALEDLRSAIEIFLQQIDERLLPNKSEFQKKLRDLKAILTQCGPVCTDADLKKMQDVLDDTESSLKEKQDSLVKIASELKEKQDTLIKTDSELKEKQDTLVKTDSELKEKQDTLIKTDSKLKEKQDTLIKTDSQLKEIQDLLVKTDSDLDEKQDALAKELKETHLAIQQADAELMEKQTYVEITLDDIQKHFSSLDEIYDPIARSKIATSVAGIHTDLQTQTYHNWIKGTLTLKYLCEGTRCFVFMMFEKFQRQGFKLPEGGSHFDNGENIQRLAVDGVKWMGAKWKYLRNNSHCDACKALFDAVKMWHRHFQSKAVFKNCRKVQVDGAWGIAKLFMPHHCMYVRSPDDLDAKALFTTIQNCGRFINFTVTEKIIKMRNKMMHSPDLTMSDDELDELYQCAKTFADEAVVQVTSDLDVKEKIVSSKEAIDETNECEIEIKALLKLGEEAMEHETEELSKQPMEDGTESQIRDKQTQIQCKLEDYKRVEELPLDSLQKTNTDVFEDMKLTLDKIIKTITVLEKTKRELEDKIQKGRNDGGVKFC